MVFHGFGAGKTVQRAFADALQQVEDLQADGVRAQRLHAVVVRLRVIGEAPD